MGGLEEERRAFYVAVTRTERTLDFLTRAEKQSRFLDEIDEYTNTIDAGQVEPLDDVGERMTVIAEVDQLLDPWTKQHQRGILADQYGGSAPFVSWANTNPPTLKTNEWYKFTNLRVGEFNDEKELTWTEDSTAEHLSTPPSITDRIQPDSSSNSSVSTETGDEQSGNRDKSDQQDKYCAQSNQPSAKHPDQHGKSISSEYIQQPDERRKLPPASETSQKSPESKWTENIPSQKWWHFVALSRLYPIEFADSERIDDR
jgi:hypothetical protein